MERFGGKRGLIFAASLLVLSLIAWVVFYLPPNSDEYIHYHIIACQKYHTPIEWGFFWGCDGSKELRLFDTWLPMRVWRYIGATSSLLYWPLFKIWPHYLSARLSGVIGFLLFTFLMGRLCRLKPLTTLIFVGFNFPIAVQMIADTGPLSLQMVSIPLVILLLNREKWIYGLLAGLICFLGMEAKGVYALMLPALIMCGLCYFGLDETTRFTIRRYTRVSLWIRITLASIIFSTLCYILYFKTFTPEHTSYFHSLQDRGVGEQVGIFEFHKLWFHFTEGMHEFFRNISNFAHRTLAPPGFGMNVPSQIHLVIWAICFLYSIYLLKLKKPLAFIGFFGFLVTMLLIVKTPSSWAGHHVILSFPFLMIGITSAIKEIELKNQKAFFAIALMWILIHMNAIREPWVKRSPTAPNDWSRLTILNYFANLPKEKTKNNVYLNTDWGLYHLFGLYASHGEPVGLLGENRIHPGQIDIIENLAKEHPYRFVFIGTPNVAPYNTLPLQERFTGWKWLPIPGLSADSVWKVWVWNGKGTP